MIIRALLLNISSAGTHAPMQRDRAGALLCVWRGNGGVGRGGCHVRRCTRVGHGEVLEVSLLSHSVFVMYFCSHVYCQGAGGCDAEAQRSAARRNGYVVAKKALLYICSEIFMWQTTQLYSVSLCLNSLASRVRHLARVYWARCFFSYFLCSDVVSDRWRSVTFQYDRLVCPPPKPPFVILRVKAPLPHFLLLIASLLLTS